MDPETRIVKKKKQFVCSGIKNVVFREKELNVVCGKAKNLLCSQTIKCIKTNLETNEEQKKETDRLCDDTSIA